MVIENTVNILKLLEEKCYFQQHIYTYIYISAIVKI